MAHASVSCIKPALNSPAETSLEITDILGVALFDLSGLPRDYFVTEENSTTHWVQIVFQALGLRSLLSSSLELEDFHQVTIKLEATTAIVVRRQQDYIALQFKGQMMTRNQMDEKQFIAFIEALDLDQLRQHPHFRVS